MLSRLRPSIERFVNAWPGERQLGIYRFLPLFFGLGAALEFSMINWTVGTTNFYTVYKRRQAKEIVEGQLHDQNLNTHIPHTN